jgi:predicted deacylase
MSLGKTIVVAEAGRSGMVLAEDLELLTSGVRSVLAALHMTEGGARPLVRPVWLDASTRLAADSAGMFFATVGRGMYVTEGTELGYTTDFLGRVTGEVRSPTAGVVTFIRGVPSAWKGATLVTIGRVLTEVPAYRKPGS